MESFIDVNVISEIKTKKPIKWYEFMHISNTQNKDWYLVEVYDFMYVLLSKFQNSKLFNFIEFKLLKYEVRIMLSRWFDKQYEKHYKKSMFKF